MRRTIIALIAATPLVAVGAYAFAAQPSTTATGDDLFRATAASSAGVAEKAEPLKALKGKTIRLGDDQRGEVGEGVEDAE